MADEDARRSDFLGALNTEYFVLQGVSSATISESSSRSSLYLLTLSSSLVSIGFVLGSSPEIFIPFATAALSTVFLLGWFTVFRLIDTSVANIRAMRSMVRIRRYYASLHDEAPRFFVTSGDDGADAAAVLGVSRPSRSFLGTMASMIGAVNAIVGGAAVAVLVGWLSGSTMLALLVALVVTAAVFGAVMFVEYRRFRTEFPPAA